jgi:phenylacetate-coenzyme A ligase PaaK-like adenylate-forming protein
MNKIQVPDPSALNSVQALCDLNTPYEITPHSEELFVEGMKEIVQWHSRNNLFFKKLIEFREFTPEHLKTVKDCFKVPFVLANYFKVHEELSISKDKIVLHATSSGTTGQKSQFFFDDWTLRGTQRMIDWIFEFYGWTTPQQPANYLLYSYEPVPDLKLGTAYTDNFLCQYAPVNHLFYALRRTGSGSHEFDRFGCIEQLIQYSKEKLPVRIFGFPAFLHFTLERMRELEIPPLELSPDSLIFLGGGWKGYAEEQIDKRELYHRVTEQLGIPDHRIRDGFGSVEHSIPYIECEQHEFHVPIWSKVFIRDVKTLEPLPPGLKGFLHFVTPVVTSVPACSVLMGDLASWHEGDSCPCPLKTPYFVVHGRAGISKNKSCAVTAAEMLGKERRGI